MVSPLIMELTQKSLFLVPQRKIFSNLTTKDWPAKKVTIFNTIVHLVKTSENIWFFDCSLPDYVADEITKEF